MPGRRSELVVLADRNRNDGVSREAACRIVGKVDLNVDINTGATVNISSSICRSGDPTDAVAAAILHCSCHIVGPVAALWGDAERAIEVRNRVLVEALEVQGDGVAAGVAEALYLVDDDLDVRAAVSR